ncbi:bifunctional YncE family protein/alkaline phosphatase family protein [Paenibacillus filicis]|uniref:Bifunctional YncE family protein/alkaline phosphatase family protein n=1 Tax=Paenibacillus gyeongsangnamensis TaxID=3388067 RepID=A0ABT4QIF3_9BACL|nr:bifunctional YncE family protein/alkaline phosphatase family protein [Paenibacillus filicis]MCZ8516656.1 bifunctional YncE family protein/alkaline phosphatase family protein [Paenibacillus filicis]
MKKPIKSKKIIASVALSAVLFGSGSVFAASTLVAGPKADGTGVNSHGWSLTPAGTQVNLGNKPFGAAISPDHKYLIVSNDGSPKSLQVVDVLQQKVVFEVKPPEGLFLGVVFSPDGKTVYASGVKDKITVFQFDNGILTEKAPIVMQGAQSLNPFLNMTSFSPAGISISSDGKFLYTANNMNNSVSMIDLSTGQVKATTNVGNHPYTAFLTHNGGMLYVTNWGESSVSVLNPNDLSVVHTIAVGLHPNAIAENPVNGMIYVANSDSDEISIIDPAKQQEIQKISLAPFKGAQVGSIPNALTISQDGKTMYVSNAGNNDIAVVDLDSGKGPEVKGLIPTAWYPSGVFINEETKQLMVINTKGLGSGPNTQHQYIGSLIKGSLSFINIPDDKQLKQYTKQVEDNNTVYKVEGDGWLKGFTGEDNNPIPQFEGQKSPIKHVIYVIRENRTYDQVLGDLGKGNGDPSLTEFGRSITPNIHKLAEQYVTLDNFYVDAEASPDGHDWTVSGIANDFKEKSYRQSDHLYDYEGKDSAEYSQSGHIWNNFMNHGLTFRNYGEMTRNDATTNQWVPNDKSVGSNNDVNYPGWTLAYTDLQRFDEWNNEFQQFVKNGNLPALETVQMPGDHTNGTKPGTYTPQAFVAQNDLAIGKMVDAVSHSPYWKDTAIFVIEDDAQAGADHVDAHRTEALVISPYTQTGKVDSTFYSTSSMLRTMELFFGLKPMTQFDASAIPMLNSFTNHPNFAPYKIEQPQYPIDLKNGQNAPMAQVSMNLDFSKPDAADPDTLNRVLWAATKGNQPYPKNVR